MIPGEILTKDGTLTLNEGRDVEDLGSAAPVIDWASVRHETQYTRLFRS